jgi:hypothetical protein
MMAMRFTGTIRGLRLSSQRHGDATTAWSFLLEAIPRVAETP